MKLENLSKEKAQKSEPVELPSLDCSLKFRHWHQLHYLFAISLKPFVSIPCGKTGNTHGQSSSNLGQFITVHIFDYIFSVFDFGNGNGVVVVVVVGIRQKCAWDKIFRRSNQCIHKFTFISDDFRMNQKGTCWFLKIAAQSPKKSLSACQNMTFCSIFMMLVSVYANEVNENYDDFESTNGNENAKLRNKNGEFFEPNKWEMNR